MSQEQVRVARLDDPELRAFVDLTDQQARTASEPVDGIYIAEGRKVIERAVSAGHRPLRALTTARWLPGIQQLLGSTIPVHLGDEELLQQITGYRVHRGALVAFARPRDVGLAETIRGAQQIVILEDLKEHANVGAIVRSAAAFGVDALVVSPQCADPLYRRAVKVSMGTVFTLPWCRSSHWPDDLRVLRDSGFRLAALTPDSDAITLPEYTAATTAPIAWMLGTEGPGLSAQALAHCTDRVQIPMRPGVDSLNVAAAAAVAFYAAAQRTLPLRGGTPPES